MNISGLLDLFKQVPALVRLREQLQAGAAVPPLLLSPSARPAVLAWIFCQLDQPVLFLTGRVDQITPWQQALESWLPPDRRVARFPEPTPLPYDRGPWSERTRKGRLQVLADLMAAQHPLTPVSGPPPLILSSARALLQKTISRRRFAASTRVMRVGQALDLERTLQYWGDIGYEPVSVVEAAGQYCRRGGIIDLFPISSPYPVRIELFGNEIDTIRHFDPATQRSIAVNGHQHVDHLVVSPAREALPGVAKQYATTLPEVEDANGEPLGSWIEDLPALVAGQAFPSLEYYLPQIYPQPASLLDYLPREALVVVDDWSQFQKAADDLHIHAHAIATEQPALPPGFASPIFEWANVESELQWWQPLILGEGYNQDEITPGPLSHLYDVFRPGPRYGGQVRPLLQRLRQALDEGDRVVVVSRQAARLAELWSEDGLRRPVDGPEPDPSSPLILSSGETGPRAPVPVESLPDLSPPGTLSFVQGSLAEGFTLIRPEDGKILAELLTDAEVFGWKRPVPRRVRVPRPIAPETRFADIETGNYVVHIEYGIGRFEGLVVRLVGGMEREYLLVRYANSDTLYVPVHQADRLGKWIGGSDRPPVVHRLGEKSWTTAKTRAQRAADELAEDLLELYAARESIAGHAFSADSEWQAELEAGFPYRETEDQLRVVAEVKVDMERARPMDRLVCGDVGYGKTEVALRAAFKAVMDSKQVAVLVPTTVLAQQHFNTFRERLGPFPVQVEMLSRFRTPLRQEQIVSELRQGRIDIIIGTHRLLSDDVSFKDLGLVIIDEEQRFGVGHKERFKQWRTEVDVLTMTATPIPRTLYMSLTGARDVSIIDTPPAERLPVQTFVGEADDVRLRRAILRELDRGGQIFFVHNRVATIEIARRRLQQLVPEARVLIAHGQMSERQLEQIMLDFDEGLIDILLSTTIIESGLDFPNANTLIVDRAEMFGLAQLYQLRGRVGRSDRRAYAYFFHGPWHGLTPEAQARLETVAEETQLGAGYSIAMRDMEIRGAGDLLGSKQSGHISAVGFDLYTRLLANAVRRRKAMRSGERLPLEIAEVTLIDLPLAAYVPTDYVPDASLRLRLYRRMATLSTLEEIDDIATELADRFGPIPDPVHNLLYQLRIKTLAQAAGVVAITTDSGQIRIRLNDLEGLDRFRLQRFLGNSVRVSRKAIWMKRELSTLEWQIELVQALERLQDLERRQSKPAAQRVKADGINLF